MITEYYLSLDKAVEGTVCKMVVQCRLKILSLGIRFWDAKQLHPRDGIFNPHLTSIKSNLFNKAKDRQFLKEIQSYDIFLYAETIFIDKSYFSHRVNRPKESQFQTLVV